MKSVMDTLRHRQLQKDDDTNSDDLQQHNSVKLDLQSVPVGGWPLRLFQSGKEAVELIKQSSKKAAVLQDWSNFVMAPQEGAWYWWWLCTSNAADQQLQGGQHSLLVHDDEGQRSNRQLTVRVG